MSKKFPEEYVIYGQDERGDWIHIYASADRADAEGFYRRLASVKPPCPIRLVAQQIIRTEGPTSTVA